MGQQAVELAVLNAGVQRDWRVPVSVQKQEEEIDWSLWGSLKFGPMNGQFTNIEHSDHVPSGFC